MFLKGCLMTIKNADRLGDILVGKNIISASQLTTALAEQQRRRENEQDKKSFQNTVLGEILIELGYIDRLQLKRGLNWQSLVRKLTAAMALCAPLMCISPVATAASSSSSSAPKASLPLTIQAESYTSMFGVQIENTLDVGGGKAVGYIHNGDWISFSGTSVNIPVTDTYKITYRVASPTGGGSFTLKESNGTLSYDTVSIPSTGGFQTWGNVVKVVTLPAGTHSFLITNMVRGSGYNINWFKIESIPKPSSSSSSKSSSSVKSSVKSSSSSASVKSSLVAGVVNLQWKTPTKRENLNQLDITELGGYELRYRKVSDELFTYVTINDPWTNYYYFPWLEGAYIFQVAAFDKEGLYSQFIDLIPR